MFLKHTSYRMGTEQRTKNFNKENIPGAGEYSLPSYIGNGPKYTMQSKGNKNEGLKNKEGPGPAEYYPTYTTMFKNLSYTMSAKNFNNSKNISPSPAEYNVRSNSDSTSINKIQSYKFGKGTRDQIVSKETLIKPGPGNYSISERGTKSARGYSFGKEIRDDPVIRRIQTPGPGDYQSLSFIGKEGPKFTMRPKDDRSSSKRSFIPGPGQYTIHTKNKPNTPSFKMGSSKREGTFGYSKNNPGPANYNPNTFVNSFYQKSPYWTIASVPKKFYKDSEGDGPGPANYNVSKNLGFGPKVHL